jgi:hypothetical protein
MIACLFEQSTSHPKVPRVEFFPFKKTDLFSGSIVVEAAIEHSLLLSGDFEGVILVLHRIIWISSYLTGLIQSLVIAFILHVLS